MAESHVDITGSTSHNELVVRLARVKMALLMAFLLVCVALTFTQVWNERLLFRGFGYLRVIELGFLLVFITLTLIVLTGVLSPFPLFSVSHAGVRTYSMFGLFGSELTPWPEVTAIKIELSGGPRSLTIYSRHKPTRGRFVRWLSRKTPGRMRVSVMRGMTSGPFDAIVDHLLERYEGEIQRYRIQVDVRGDE